MIAELKVEQDARDEMERDIRIAIWNAAMKGGMGDDPAIAFIQRAVAEPLMEHALATRPALSPTTGEADDSLCHECWRTREQHDNLETRHPLCATFVSAALPLAPREGWQEISTALDNGGNFLVGWIGRPTVTIATFNAAGRLVELEDFSGWIEGGEPTHWQPLPAAPAALSRTGEMSRG